MQVDPKTLQAILLVMLRPLVRLCIRYGFGIQEFLETTKKAFVLGARDELIRTAEKVNTSRISVVTGLHRREVDRLLEGNEKPIQLDTLLSRVLSAWETRAEWKTNSGQPRILAVDREPHDFYELVRSVTKDVHPSSIVSQLERLRLVERTPYGLKLSSAAHDVRGDLTRGYEILAHDMNDIALAVEHNLMIRPEMPNLHARTEFDNIFLDSIPLIQGWFLKAGAEIHQKARTLLSEHDADLRTSPQRPAGCKAIFTCFARFEMPPTTKES